MAPTKKLSPDTAKVSTDRLTEGASVSRHKKIENSMSKIEKHGNDSQKKPSPLVGEGVNRQVDGRGKREQKRKNKNMYEQKQKISKWLLQKSRPRTRLRCQPTG